MSRSNRRRFLKHGGLATAFAGFATAFGLTPFSPARAATVSPHAALQILPLVDSEAKSHINNVLSSQNYHRFQQQVHKEYIGVLTIQEHAATAQSFSDGQHVWIQVHVPIAGGEGHSHYSAFYQRDTPTISQTFGSLFTLTPEQNIVAVVEKNGVVVADLTATPDGDVIQGKAYKPDGTKVVLDGTSLNPAANPDIYICWWNCTANCLGNFGLPIALMGVAGFICGFGCANPETGVGIAVCAVCIVGVVGGTVGIVTYCIDICWC
jgi:hypothetical protein